MRVIKQAAFVGAVTFATASAFSALVLAQPGAKDGKRVHGQSGGDTCAHKGAHGNHRGHAKGDYLTKLRTALDLSDAQVQALRAARADARQARVREEGGAESRQSMRRALESVLTPEQLAKLVALTGEIKERRVAKKMERLTAILELSPQQQLAIRQILGNTLQDSTAPAAENRREAWQARRAAVRDEIRAVLNENQRRRFDAMKQQDEGNRWRKDSRA